MTKTSDELRALFPFLHPDRPWPKGVSVNSEVDLYRYLPFRLHRLAVRVGFVGKGTNGLSNRKSKGDKATELGREWRLMLLLASLGPLANTEIAELTGMNTATISRAVALLTKRGLVMTKGDPSDRRRTLMSLTAEGAELYDRIIPNRVAVVDELEKCLTDSERATFYELLDKLEQQLTEMSDKEAALSVDW